MSSTGSRRPRATRSRARKASGGAANVDGGTVAPPEGGTAAGFGDFAATFGDVAATFGEAAATSEPHRRSSSYRAETREAAASAYHADALVMARMGYVPESEAWSTQLEQVLMVGYVHAPDRTAAVLEAVTQAEADQLADPGGAPALPPTAPTLRRLGAPVALEATLLAGSLGGAVAGAAIYLVLTGLAGESFSAIILGGFAVLGLFLGSIAGFARD